MNKPYWVKYQTTMGEWCGPVCIRRFAKEGAALKSLKASKNKDYIRVVDTNVIGKTLPCKCPHPLRCECYDMKSNSCRYNVLGE